jgi:hypothetical protein
MLSCAWKSYLLEKNYNEKAFVQAVSEVNVL